MSDKVCPDCGASVKIRTINGLPVPIGCQCQGGSPGPVARVRRSRFLDLDFRRARPCRYCGAPVFFVRYNGGSVWLDELGRPWPKHGCYYNQPSGPAVTSWLGENVPNDAWLGIIARKVTEPSASKTLCVVGILGLDGKGKVLSISPRPPTPCDELVALVRDSTGTWLTRAGGDRVRVLGEDINPSVLTLANAFLERGVLDA